MSLVPPQILPYTSNREYRQCLRRVLNMDADNYKDSIQDLENALHDDFDEETRDEMEYDDASASKVMDAIFAATQNHPLFQELYELAAARMMSTDRNIGLAVLFSYDFLALFHACILVFTEDPTKFTENCATYTTLRKQFN